MKRYLLAPRIGTGQTRDDPYRADLTIPWIQVAKLGAYWLVKVNVADGAALDDLTIADLDSTNKAIKSAALTVAQRNALATWLTNHGYSATGLTASIANRADLLLFVVRSLANRTGVTLETLIRGYDIA